MERLVGTIPQNPDQGWDRCPALAPVRLNREPADQEDPGIVPPASPPPANAPAELPVANFGQALGQLEDLNFEM